MTVFAMTSFHRGDHCVAQSVHEAGAFSSVVAADLVKQRAGSVSPSIGGDVDPVVAGEALKIRARASAPFGRAARTLVFTVMRVRRLVDPGRSGGPDECVGAKRIEEVS